MAQIPVVCNKCEKTFIATNLIGGTGTVTLTNVEYGPCPFCGGQGRVLDGTYSFVGEVTNLLQAPQRTVDELQKLASIFEDAQKYGAGKEEIREQVQREAPQLASIADLLPRNRAEVYAFLALVIAIIQLLLSSSGSIQNVDVDIDQVTNITFQQQRQQRASESQMQQIPKVGRNEPCPCGSGKKYKKCHGDPLRHQETLP